MSGGYAGDVNPREAWELLCSDPRAVLVDVRTPAEWAYVGIPNLAEIGKKPVLIPWLEFPTMQVNEGFVSQAAKEIAAEAPVVLLCRSGARSMAAAIALTKAGIGPCYNIVSGFEGDPDAERHRGSVSGWKVEGLPWMQT
ncbi:MAG: rhodanese-like domain-containing protein [Rhodospirillales bacterium]|nr:rhodanese-like domain-containing protein [Rhodospirillales bacterium]